MSEVDAISIVRPITGPAELIEAHTEISEIIKTTLKRGVDYGLIPGVAKNSLFKAGAERLIKAFGASVKYKIVSSQVDHNFAVSYEKRHWSKEERRYVTRVGSSVGLYRYVVKCSVFSHSGHLIAEQIASCSTLESKYVDRPRDSENTVLKMAEKRAFVGATLNAFGLSDRFTQDVEDFHTKEEVEVKPKPVYDNTDPQKVLILQELLTKRSVPAIHHVKVGEMLHGKASSELDKILKELKI